MQSQTNQYQSAQCLPQEYFSIYVVTEFLHLSENYLLHISKSKNRKGSRDKWVIKMALTAYTDILWNIVSASVLKSSLHIPIRKGTSFRLNLTNIRLSFKLMLLYNFANPCLYVLYNVLYFWCFFYLNSKIKLKLKYYVHWKCVFCLLLRDIWICNEIEDLYERLRTQLSKAIQLKWS